MAEPLQIGRYVLHDEIASGGMAKVHLGRAIGALGFSRIVAIKRILPHLLVEQEFVEMFVDETRLAARIQHPNVVSTLDAVVTEGEVFLVMEHVLGESTARLLRTARTQGELVPAEIVVSIGCGLLRGLHAAHETRNDVGDLLGVVHRDVSPQNVLVGVDGVTRIIDFGVAKARGRLSTTRDGQIKGKLAYMSPEQLRSGEPDRRTDVYATGVILWEALAGKRLHYGDNDAIVYANVLHNPVDPPSRFAPHVSADLDDVVMRAIARDPDLRFSTTEEMALALEQVLRPASQSAVGDWVRRLGGQVLAARAARVAEIERGVFAPAASGSLIADTGSSPSVSSAGASSTRAVPGVAASTPVDFLASDDSAAGFGRSMHHEVPAKAPRVLRTIVVATLLASAGASVVLVLQLVPRPVHAPPPATLAAATPPIPETSSPALPTASQARSSQAAATTVLHAEALPPTTSRSDAASAPPPKVTAKPIAAARPPMSACSPPWYIDAKGIKRFKPECM